ncbi:DHH family phosphoesterase [Vibrio sp. S4M6]|uniref:DHH family phosphoesterase n=1 Tax=Vibrio sinus TaxID=2946865 RepID=UPI00202A3754|nr:DHH family phosphoesterase [Vibrio sinus]MCL9780412.1 DHH family phosphoesterase [Vibrio sinus]
MHYDVFNGDADGIIALLQLRLAEPKQSKLITGVKRDIQLLRRVESQTDVTSVTVLDVSMDKNLIPLHAILQRNIPVFYCDHHRANEIPESDKLSAKINTDAEVCTSLLVNDQLQGRYFDWAMVGAYGDNLFSTANKLAAKQGISEQQRLFLQQLGTLINYNGYGSSIDDLHIPPAELFAKLINYASPYELKDDKQSPYYRLKQAYEADQQRLDNISPLFESTRIRAFELPDAAWSRRVNGVFSNQLANQSPSHAHAVLVINPSGQSYTVSVRAPLNHRVGADDVCCQFATGGGRKAAAGINALPVEEKTAFLHALESYYH